MGKYRVVVTTVLEIEAKDQDEAYEKALNYPNVEGVEGIKQVEHDASDEAA